jgi:hypothetical protein
MYITLVVCVYCCIAIAKVTTRCGCHNKQACCDVELMYIILVVCGCHNKQACCDVELMYIILLVCVYCCIAIAKVTSTVM